MCDTTEDQHKWGAGRWVYCPSHMRPHETGWCTVRADEKTLLDARDREAAITEATAKGLKVIKWK